jgi:hypothetical protein
VLDKYGFYHYNPFKPNLIKFKMEHNSSRYSLRSPNPDLATAFIGSLALNLEQGGIPDAKDLEVLTFIFGKIIRGQVCSTERVNCLWSSDSLRGPLDYPAYGQLGSKIAIGIESAFRHFNAGRVLARKILEDPTIFISEYSPGRGRVYFFRSDRLRQEMRKKIEGLFSRDERAKLLNMGLTLEPYKDRIYASLQLA